MEGESQGEKGLKRAGQQRGRGWRKDILPGDLVTEGGGKKKSRPSGRGRARGGDWSRDHARGGAWPEA